MLRNTKEVTNVLSVSRNESRKKYSGKLYTHINTLKEKLSDYGTWQKPQRNRCFLLEIQKETMNSELSVVF